VGTQNTNANRDMNSEGQVLYGNEDSNGNWNTGNSHYIMIKTLSTLYLCPEILLETDIKGEGLIHLVKEISRQPSI
jgi:hypothetical protein